MYDRNYHKCRKLFPKAPAQLIIRAKDSVYAAYKSIKSNKKLDSLKAPCEQHNLSIRLDKRLYTFTVNPAFTSQNDHRGLSRGDRMGCRYYASDGVVFDADWNASINIARKYTLKQEINKIYHPISFSSPFDGGLNFLGRVLSTTQSSPVVRQT